MMTTNTKMVVTTDCEDNLKAKKLLGKRRRDEKVTEKSRRGTRKSMSVSDDE